MVSAAATGVPFRGHITDGANCVGVDVGSFEGFDLAQRIDDTSAELEKPRSLTLPPSLFKGSRRYLPAVGSLRTRDLTH